MSNILFVIVLIAYVFFYMNKQH